MRGTSHPVYEHGQNDLPLRYAFANDLETLIDAFADVAPIWIHGHTHYTHVTQHVMTSGNCVTVAANQRGYEDDLDSSPSFCSDVQPISVFCSDRRRKI